MSIKDSLAVDEMGGENAHERNASRGRRMLRVRKGIHSVPFQTSVPHRTTWSHTHSKNRGVTSPPEA